MKTWGLIVTWLEGNLYHISQGELIINGVLYRFPETIIEIKNNLT